MGKKGAHSGMSPKDVSALAMDRFIQRNDRKRNAQERLPGRRKDKNVPIDLWPLKDQIEYYDNRTEQDRFLEAFPSYSFWYDRVKRESGVYPATFMDFTSNLKEVMQKLYDDCVQPRMAVLELRKYGVY